MEENKIIVDLENQAQVSKTMDYILDNLDALCEISYKYSGIEYGIISSSEFVEHTINFDKVHNYSELAFFQKAVTYKGNINKILAFIDKIIQKNKKSVVWFDDETPMGLNAAFSLVYFDKKYSTKFIEFLRTNDLECEVYQEGFINILEEKWGLCDEILEIFAARANSISGQYDIEYHGDFNLSEEQKKIYFIHLLNDIYTTQKADVEFILSICEFLKIDISKENKAIFSQLFIDKYADCEYFDAPTFKESDIPDLANKLLAF